MFNFIKNMAFNITDVIVDRISLVSKGKKPAVPRAETKFSIFKIANAMPKEKISKDLKEKLEKISKDYESFVNK
jgi:hypothetical protein